MLAFNIAFSLYQLGDMHPAAAVGAEPLAGHEEIAVVRPEAVERLASGGKDCRVRKHRLWTQKVQSEFEFVLFATQTLLKIKVCGLY